MIYVDNAATSIQRNDQCPKSAASSAWSSRCITTTIAPPHFHVRYGKQKAVIGIDLVELLEGKLSPKAKSLVLEWAEAHRTELMADWELARLTGASAQDRSLGVVPCCKTSWKRFLWKTIV